ARQLHEVTGRLPGGSAQRLDDDRRHGEVARKLRVENGEIGLLARVAAAVRRRVGVLVLVDLLERLKRSLTAVLRREAVLAVLLVDQRQDDEEQQEEEHRDEDDGVAPELAHERRVRERRPPRYRA